MPKSGPQVRAGQHPAVGVSVAVDDQLDALQAQVGKRRQQRGGAGADGGAAAPLADPADLTNDGVLGEHRGDGVRIVRVPGRVGGIVHFERAAAQVDHRGRRYHGATIGAKRPRDRSTRSRASIYASG